MMQRQGAPRPERTPDDESRRSSASAAAAAAAIGDERPGLPARTGEYLREVRSELQKVAWPGRSEVTNYTIVVFIAVVLLTLFVFGLDYGFAKAMFYLFPHVK